MEPDEAINRLSSLAIGAAIEVHRSLGPGLAESAYESALAVELAFREIPFERQVHVGVRYRGVPVGRGRVDFIVAGRLVVELKTVAVLTAVHVGQVLGYLRAVDEVLGLLLNFEVGAMKDGIRRVVRSTPSD